jgi:general stress protein 26
MGEVKNLERTQAIDKLKKLAEGINICMFCTKADNVPFQSRPMATQQVDDNGDFWFISSAESHKNWEIRDNDVVQLIYAKPGDSQFISVNGHAIVVKDRQKLDEIWNDIAKAWFPEGKDDPNITIIRVRPDHAYYWDTKHGKMVSMLKIAVAAVTGNPKDDGVEGNLSLKN